MLSVVTIRQPKADVEESEVIITHYRGNCLMTAMQ